MATRTQVFLEDDIDGGTADETVSFAVNGVSYEIDLSDPNVQRLQEALEPFVAKARRVGGTGRSARQKGRGGGGTDSKEQQAIRTWATDNGYKVSDRGRISAGVVEAYKTAH